MDANEDTASHEQELITLYKQLHRIPQLGLQQHKTTSIIHSYIAQIPQAKIIQPELESELKTGLIAAIDPIQKSTEGDYLFRCDIDALPFKEQSGLEYASESELHHACGHDGHTAIMLVALKMITKQRARLRRRIVFCFQPGEEGHGGASKLLARHPSLLNTVQHCFALHIANHKPKSTLLIPSLYVTTNSNRFTLQILGRSSHCMLPHMAIDANYLGCQIVNEIYSLKTRLLEPMAGMAIAVTRIQGGENVNSVAGRMRIWGSVRSYDCQAHQRVLGWIQKYAKGICELNGAECRFEVNANWYRAVKNDSQVNQIVAKAAEGLFDHVQYSGPSFAGEDFCQFSQKRPSCYFNLGVALPDSIDLTTKQSKYPIHSNKFKLDESALYNGCKLWLKIALS